jgi:hypothetical protein
MPNKRDVLSHLHRDEIIGALGALGLTVPSTASGPTSSMYAYLGAQVARSAH